MIFFGGRFYEAMKKEKRPRDNECGLFPIFPSFLAGKRNG
jgi:hypothetical protein